MISQIINQIVLTHIKRILCNLEIIHIIIKNYKNEIR